jgi:hypothetical protein
MQAVASILLSWEIVDRDRLCRTPGGGGRRPPMSPTVPVVTLVVLVVLSLIAKERKYDMTGTGLMVLAGVLATWFAALFFNLG